MFAPAIAFAVYNFSLCSLIGWEFFVVLLLLLKVQRQADASFSVIQNSCNEFCHGINLLNIRLKVHIRLTFQWRGSVSLAIYDCPNWQYCTLDTWIFFPLLLILFHKLTFQEGIFATPASLIPYCVHQL